MSAKRSPAARTDGCSEPGPASSSEGRRALATSRLADQASASSTAETTVANIVGRADEVQCKLDN